jgi:hypothetical protein
MTGTFPSITIFPLSTLEVGDWGITGFTKIVWEVEGISEVEGGRKSGRLLKLPCVTNVELSVISDLGVLHLSHPGIIDLRP